MMSRASVFGLCAALLSSAGQTFFIGAFGFIIGEALLPTAIAAGLGVLDWRWLWLLVGMFVLVAAIPLMRVLAAPLVNAAAMTGADGHSGEGAVAKASTLAAAGAGSSDVAKVGAGAGGAQPHTTLMTRRALLAAGRFLAPMSVLLAPPFVVTAIFLHQNGLGALRGWSQAQIAAAFVGFALSQLIATFTAGRLVDAFGSVKLMRVYLWGLAVGVLGLGYVDGLAGLWLLFCGLGITAGSNNVLAGAV